MNIVTAPGIDSHLPVLRWAQKASSGSVLEFGGGLHSTSALVMWDWLGYRTATIEEDVRWRDYLAERYPTHRIVASATQELLAERWGVVLIDHGEGEWTWIDARAKALEAVRGFCQIAMVHDWHIGPGHRDDIVGSFRYHGWFAPDGNLMHTAICSDVIDVTKAEIVGGRIYTSWEDAPMEWPN